MAETVSVRVRMLNKGSKAVLKSPGVQSDIYGRIQRVEMATGEGYEGDVQLGKTRTIGMVKTITSDAAKENAEYHVLLLALERGR